MALDEVPIPHTKKQLQCAQGGEEKGGKLQGGNASRQLCLISWADHKGLTSPISVRCLSFETRKRQALTFQDELAVAGHGRAHAVRCWLKLRLPPFSFISMT